jgi:WD40 repeat protein
VTGTYEQIPGGSEDHVKGVLCTRFSRDGRYIASGSFHMTVRVWDAKTGARLAGPFKGHPNWVTCVAFSPDCKYLASGSLDIRIWGPLGEYYDKELDLWTVGRSDAPRYGVGCGMVDPKKNSGSLLTIGRDCGDGIPLSLANTLQNWIYGNMFMVQAGNSADS